MDYENKHLKIIVSLLAALLLSGCAARLTKVEFYQPANEAELSRGYGALKTAEFGKGGSGGSGGGFTLFGLSVF